MATVALIHSPLLGPETWGPVAEELRRDGAEAVVPDLGTGTEDGEPFWRQHARAAAVVVRGLPADRRPVLVAHSGAGVLLPAIRGLADRPVAAYVFVDAGLPHEGSRIGGGPWADQLRALYAGGGRFPNWTDADLAGLVPDPAARRRLLADLRPQPLAFWEEPIPIPAGWPDAPCAYLRFPPNPAYDDDAAEARRLGWPYAEIPGGHFHMLVDPPAVATAIVGLLRRMNVA
jgi:hypothetical protein